MQSVTQRVLGKLTVRLLVGLASVAFATRATAGTLRTWVGPTAGLWSTGANWSDGDIPDSAEEDVLIDGSAESNVVVTNTITAGVTMTNGMVTVNEGDQLDLRGTGYNGTAGFRMARLANAGDLSLTPAPGNNSQTTALVVEQAGDTINTASGVLTVSNNSGRNRITVSLNVPAESRNDGQIACSITSSSDRDNCILYLTGSGTFVNNGTILVRNTQEPTSTEVRCMLNTTGAAVTLAGNGTMTLDVGTIADPTRARLRAASATGLLTNAPTHTIDGAGEVGANMNVVNEGLMEGTGETAPLALVPASTLVNTATGRIVGSGAAGVRIGSHTAARTFTNAGVLEARTGGTVQLATNLVATLGGTLRGGGTLVGSPTVTLASTTLQPGDSANADGTGASTVGAMAVSGNLVLSDTTTLSVQLGNDGVAGTDYDTINVSGNLTLDGALAVEALAGYGAGTYRLFTCAPGGLTDNGLASVAGAVVVTDLGAGTVDLVVADAATLLLVR